MWVLGGWLLPLTLWLSAFNIFWLLSVKALARTSKVQMFSNWQRLVQNHNVLVMQENVYQSTEYFKSVIPFICTFSTITLSLVSVQFHFGGNDDVQCLSWQCISYSNYCGLKTNPCILLVPFAQNCKPVSSSWIASIYSSLYLLNLKACLNFAPQLESFLNLPFKGKYSQLLQSNI